jgi:hypothetical protein
MCTSSTDNTIKGTCYTASECVSKGGTSSGNCASGIYNTFRVVVVLFLVVAIVVVFAKLLFFTYFIKD